MWIAYSDHPRIRGEHPAGRVDDPRFSGSSPHTRGARDRYPRPEGRWRIIPAYAGSTLAAARRWPSAWDHPRIRGEHAQRIAVDGAPPGSSPHTRGAPTNGTTPRATSRIIPAYAGSTSIAARTVSRSWGSSPHTRGAPRRRVRHRRYPGIIPAYAGSTAAHRRHGRGVWDHPRIRGEHPLP